MDEQAGDVTRILSAIGAGRTDRVDELLQVVYAELHRMAERRMAGERPGHTLQPTALVHEAYLRLAGSLDGKFDCRAHFFTAAGEAMRRILIDRARARGTGKRGGDRGRVEFDRAEPAHDGTDPVDLLALDRALTRLEEKDTRMATIVKLRYFAGMSVEETAEVLGLSGRSVIRSWVAAKAWLHRELMSDEP